MNTPTGAIALLKNFIPPDFNEIDIVFYDYLGSSVKYLIGLVFLFFQLFSQERQDPRFKLYCFYTPQFKTLYENYFLPSIQDDFEIVAKEYGQECPSGTFQSEGWEKTMLRKLQMLKEAIQTHWGNQIFFYSDIDVIFLRPALSILLDQLKDHDFVVQQGWPSKRLCAGFFAMRGNEKTDRWISSAMNLLEKQISRDDQSALQLALSQFNPGEISWAFLPSEQFPNGKRVLKNYTKENKFLFSSNSELSLDDSIVLFHANCCIGLETKYLFLKTVQEEFEKNRAK